MLSGMETNDVALSQGPSFHTANSQMIVRTGYRNRIHPETAIRGPSRDPKSTAGENCLLCLTDRFQAFQREQGNTSEADCPRTIQSAIQAPAFKDVFDGRGDCRLDFGGFVA